MLQHTDSAHGWTACATVLESRRGVGRGGYAASCLVPVGASALAIRFVPRRAGISPRILSTRQIRPQH